MFTIKIENNYRYSGRLVNTDTNRDWIINHHFTSASIPDLKSALLQIYGLGEVLFLDLGEEKIKGYPFPSERYGLLIRCHSTEFYYRFEQHGDIYLTIDALGCFSLQVKNGTAIQIKLPELSLKQ
ncbi:hypothetical protein ACFSQ0_08080 [Mesonia sediminis]|jgi:hypothetical protein|uniref:Uncharacterized protein n=1 Tax=Mesonia sediminis TaxID=1703946 RepID=A0ABW5SE74_9FLAO